MNNAARKPNTPALRDLPQDTLGDWLTPSTTEEVQLTLVPTEFDAPVPFVATPKRAKLSPLPPLVEVAPAPVSLPPTVPAPKKSRTGLLVVGAMGGGAMIGGGVVGGLVLLLALGAAAVAGTGAVGVGALWLLTRSAEPAPVVEVEPVVVPVEEAPVAEVPAEEAAPVKSTPKAKTPVAEPVAGTPDPLAPVAPTKPAAPAAPAPSEVPGELVALKILSEPPASVVTIDGEVKGRTPLKLMLEPGSHQLSLTNGKATGAFVIDAGMDEDRYCYSVTGKKIDAVGCN